MKRITHPKQLISSQIAFYSSTPEGEILYANSTLLEMLGFESLEELQKRNLEKEGFLFQAQRNHFKDVLDTEGIIEDFNTFWIKKDLSIISVTETAWSVKDKDNKIINYEGIVKPFDKNYQNSFSSTINHPIPINENIESYITLEQMINEISVSDHLCLIYETREELLNAIIPYIKNGIEKNEKCIYIVDECTVSEVITSLKDSNFAVEKYLDSGALNIITKDESYFRNGYFNPDEMIDFLKSEIDKALQEGFSGLRTAGEMTWASGNDNYLKGLLEYEAKLNYIYPLYPVTSLCQYNMNRFSPLIIKGVISTHPMIIYKGFIRSNYHYLEPDEYLSPQSDEIEVKRLLNNIMDYSHYKLSLSYALKEKIFELNKRNKELNCLYSISNITQNHDLSLNEMLQQIVNIIPSAFLYPEKTCACISFLDYIFESDNFFHGNNILIRGLEIGNNSEGFIKVTLKEDPDKLEEIEFLPEEEIILDAITERVSKIIVRIKAIESLNDNEEKYSKLYSLVDEGLCFGELLFDEDNNPCDFLILDINPMFEKITGTTKNEIVGKKLLDVFPLRDLPYLSIINKLKDTKEPISFEGFFLPLDKYYHASAFIIKDNIFALMLRDRTERKKFLEELKLSKEVLQSKLENVLSPDISIQEVKFQELIDVPQIQNLMDYFYKATKLPLSIIDLDGNVLVGIGWQEICLKFHRVHPITNQKCLESDLILTKNVEKGKHFCYKCKNNLWDIVTPIYIGDKHYANLFTGQFFFDDDIIDYDFFNKQADEYGFDKKEYIDALNKIPIFNRETIFNMLEFYKGLATIISGLSYSNIKLAKNIEELKQTKNLLSENEKKAKTLLDESRANIILFDLDGIVITHNKNSSERLGTIIGKNVFSVFPPEVAKSRKEIVNKVIISKQVAHFEDTFEKTRIFDTRIIPICDNEGNVDSIAVFAIDITSSKEMEKKIIEQNIHMQQAQEIAKIGYWSYNFETQIPEWSKNVFTILGCDPAKDAPNYEEHRKFIHPDDWDLFDKSVQGAYSGTPYYIEIRIVFPDNSIHHIAARGIPRTDSNGNIISLFGVTQDITDRKKAEEDLKLSENKFKEVFHYSIIPCCISDFDTGKILDANDAFFELIGYTREEVINSTILDFGVWVDINQRKHAASTILQKGYIRNYECFLKNKNGDVKIVLFSGAVLNIDKKSYAITQAIDITEKKLSEKRLYDSESKLRETMSTIDDIVFVLDKDGYFKEYYTKSEKALYVAPDEFLEKHYRDINYPEELCKEIDSAYEKLKDINYIHEFDYILQIQDNPRWYNAKVTRRVDINHRFNGITIVCREITERKRLESDLKKSKEEAERANNLKTLFLANLSHEIRTPLTSILGFSQLIQNENLFQTEILEYIGIVYNSGKHLLDIINDILELSLIESGNLEIDKQKVKLIELLEEVSLYIYTLICKKPVKFTYQIEPDVPEIILTDFTKLKQILTNIIINAVKFTNEGSVSVNISKINTSDILFSIKDTGMGIPEDKLSIIFEPFEQVDKISSRKLGGIGLGLSITRSLVKTLGGEIWVESKINNGTSFYFTIPLFDNTEKIKSLPYLYNHTFNNENFDCSHKKILLVEDVYENALLVESFLKWLNTTIIIANSGEEALQKISEENFDLILMDVQLPGIDGLETTRRIRNLGGKWQEISIIALTAYASINDEEKCRKSGCTDYLSKPMCKEDLLSKVKNYLN